MSKEVKRYAERDAYELDKAGNYYCRHVSAMTGEGLHSKSDIAAELGWRDMQIDALLAERDARLLQVDTLTDWYSNSLDVIREITAALPGAHYMDPPDGGDVSVPEQVRRMAKDAERYRWLRMSDWWDSPLCVVRNPARQVQPGSDCPSRDRLDAAIDDALQGEQP